MGQTAVRGSLQQAQHDEEVVAQSVSQRRTSTLPRHCNAHPTLDMLPTLLAMKLRLATSVGATWLLQGISWLQVNHEFHAARPLWILCLLQ